MLARKHTLTALAVLAAGLLSPLASGQGVEPTFSYQGRVLLEGEPVDFESVFLFRLWDDPDGGTMLSESDNLVATPDEDGFITLPVSFGVATPSGEPLYNDEPRYLEIVVNNQTLSPRQRLRAAPFSIATSGLWAREDVLELGEGFTNIRIGDGSSDTNLSLRRGGLRVVNGGLCVDTDGDCAPIPGAIRVGLGGLLGANTTNDDLLLQPNGEGFVGIGTSSPDAPLHIFSFERDALVLDSLGTLATRLLVNNATGNDWAIVSTGSNNNSGAGKLIFRNESQGSNALSIDPNGNIGIGTDNPTEKLDIGGAVRIRGADIVEGFDSSTGETIEPGTVVSIDPTPGNEGYLKPSDEPYDAKVAGVVSGAGGVPYGMALAYDGQFDGETKVAMTGRVYVKCSAEGGPIRPGDGLTTASLAGHAMKATDAERLDGTIIGKAMSTLEEGKGLVLVLVNLQ